MILIIRREGCENRVPLPSRSGVSYDWYSMGFPYSETPTVGGGVDDREDAEE